MFLHGFTVHGSSVPFWQFHGVISRVKVTSLDQFGHLKGSDTQVDSPFLMSVSELIRPGTLFASLSSDILLSAGSFVLFQSLFFFIVRWYFTFLRHTCGLLVSPGLKGSGDREGASVDDRPGMICVHRVSSSCSHEPHCLSWTGLRDGIWRYMWPVDINYGYQLHSGTTAGPSCLRWTYYTLHNPDFSCP